MTDALLLPSSSTGLERDLSTSMDALPRLSAAAELIRDAKRENIPDSVVPFLLYEYGLGELLPYLSDPRTAISTGVLWQRLRGTPKSFSIALGWIGNDGTIEESEGNTINWSQFQLGLDSAPVDLSQTDSVVEIGRLSSPVRSSLFRIYGGWYDGRRFKLDNHELSGIDTLCDHTGVYLKSEWPQLSFGREFKDEQGDISGDLAAALGIHRATGINGRYEDRTILSNSLLGETSWRTLHIEDLASVISRLHFSVVGPFWKRATDWSAYSWGQVFDWAGLQNKFTPAFKFAKAGMYLSDYSELGDTNSCFPARSLDEFGDGAVQLSEGDPATGEGILSEHLSRVEFTEINERIEHETETETSHVGSIHGRGESADPRVLSREHFKVHPYDDSFQLSASRLDEHIPLVNEGAITREHTTSALFPQPSSAWNDTGHTWNETLSWVNFSSRILRFSLAGVCLSETGFLSDGQGELGDTQATLSFTTSERFERSHTTQVAHVPPQILSIASLKREHQRILPYDDSFELSRTRLDEFIPLVNTQAITREHTRQTNLQLANSSQLARVLNFYQSHLYLSDSNDGLSGTDAVLGWPTSQRFDQNYYAQATENRQSFTTRQHTRAIYFVTPWAEADSNWNAESWAGADAFSWAVSSTDWDTSSWDSDDWLEGQAETWANQQMWVKMGRWQIASELVESIHETHV